ncbi:hypothetical protein HMPREF9630_02054 [Peptoanaerobacter stomatis]|uniref:NodB homology domain-containing protein n=1 Tax=Peptoanaerobacter stomatis TaxID=796937 RepID=V9HTY5_9FIRM|nr:polysaccharide deacetylase family protein [Peptoanaerobacter stomatis]EHL15656.1 hypothetical protein HMPREF9630_02054 [Peptoanaerobacter stomatis]
MNEITIVMYHYVRELENTRYPNIKGLKLSEFKKQIEYFKQRYTFICLEDIFEAIYGGKKLKENSIFLTFDDGYLDHYTNVFPILKNNGIRGFFSMPAKILNENELLDVNKIHYILAVADENSLIKKLYEKLDYYRGIEFNYPSNDEIFNEINVEKSRFDNENIIFLKRVLQTYLPYELRNKIVDELFLEYVLENDISKKNILLNETYMNMEQIKLMIKSGMSFGLHGYNHEHLKNMSIEDMKKDIDKSIYFWDEIIDKNCLTICYPYGSYNKDTVSYAIEKGCKLGFSTKIAKTELNLKNALTLSRFDTNDFYPKSK